MFLVKDMRDGGKEWVIVNPIEKDVIAGFCMNHLGCSVDDVEVYIPTPEEDAELLQWFKRGDGDVVARNGKLAMVRYEQEEIMQGDVKIKKNKLNENGENLGTFEKEIVPKRVAPIYERDENGNIPMVSFGRGQKKQKPAKFLGNIQKK